MSQLEDRRPVAATTTASAHPNVVGEDLAHLLSEHPDIELSTIRLIPNEDGTVGIAGRIGALAGVDCPQCHQPAGRPHTDYCTLDPGAVWDDQPLGVDCPSCYRLRKVTPDSHCSKPELHTEPQGPPMHAWTDDNGTPRAHPVSTCNPTLCGLEPW